MHPDNGTNGAESNFYPFFPKKRKELNEETYLALYLALYRVMIPCAKNHRRWTNVDDYSRRSSCQSSIMKLPTRDIVFRTFCITRSRALVCRDLNIMHDESSSSWRLARLSFRCCRYISHRIVFLSRARRYRRSSQLDTALEFLAAPSSVFQQFAIMIARWDDIFNDVLLLWFLDYRKIAHINLFCSLTKMSRLW